ncbi:MULTISPECIES: phage terminase large subunit family protein [Roseomonadaceae]|uniref:Phage terminase large subunit family protein n=1 Tax=Falsiroseomonas oleicola TaxID=2801474 RepID=A0ABS6H936_9PROT|nr:terminase gpA endonuclease subunit [Roseomonas oleicola]MBU8543986.1 phage terminase large subunit family protein [Roseomonas oleicola]
MSPPPRMAAPPEATAVFGAAARALRPNPRRNVAEWAEAERVVSAESGSPWPGRWSTARVPYLREIMKKLSLSHPARRVTFRKSAQIGGSECGVNMLGQIMAETPAPVLVVLPTDGEAADYNRLKLDPTIRETPALRSQVKDQTSRDERGSTSFFKRFPGGYLQLVGANTPKKLEMRTARVILFEEISKYPRNVEGRGSPIKLALSRTDMYTGREKIFDCSTPHVKGQCEVSSEYELGSKAAFHVPCPHCGFGQELLFANLRFDSEADEPDSAEYFCQSPLCGEAIAPHQKEAMMTAGAWVHERPELENIHPSYRINILYSPVVPWVDVARRYQKARKDPTGGLRPFYQQALGEPWDEAFDLPKADILLARGDAWPVKRIPPGVLFLAGGTDVQGNRLVWAVWGFDRNFGQWLIETGELHGDPTQDLVWRQHEALLGRSWRDAWGREVRPRSWGIDSGYLSGHVYRHVLMQAGRHPFQVMALDGREKWGLPPIGKESWRPVRSPGQEHIPPEQLPKCPIYPVGTWDLKSELASAIRLTERGPGPEGWSPGALRWNGQMVDRAWIEELLAERFMEDPKTGKRVWARLAARNEAWDLAVYTRAQARAMSMSLTAEDWDALIAETQGAPEAAQGDLLAMVTPSLKAEAEAARRGQAERERLNEAEPEAPPPNMTAWGPAPSWTGGAAW